MTGRFSIIFRLDFWKNGRYNPIRNGTIKKKGANGVKKRWLLLGAVCVCLCLCFCGCAHWWELIPSSTETAAPTATATAATPAVTIAVEGGTAAVGDTVIIPVTVTAEADLVDADIFLRYDPAVLEPVKQYDAETDTRRYAEPGIFTGSVRSELVQEGILYVMLASSGEGVTQKGTLFYVAFRLLSDTMDEATLSPEVTSCHLFGENGDRDAVAEGILALKQGKITPITPPSDTTATKIEE